MARRPTQSPRVAPGALHWSTAGLDADSCKIRVGGTTLAKELPTNVDGWPIPAARIKDGTRFSIVCTAGGVKHTAETVLAVA